MYLHAPMEELPRAEEIVARAREQGERDRVSLSGPAREALRRAVAELAADLGEATPGAVATASSREEARALLPGAEQLIGRIFAAKAGSAEEQEWLDQLAKAASGLVAAAAAIARGAPEGTGLVDKARSEAVVATRTLPAWAIGKAEDSPVYDKGRGLSRYDARQEDVASYRLTCPATGCHKDHLYGWSARHSTHRFTCVHCGRPFTAYLGEVRRLSVEASGVVAQYHQRTDDHAGTPRSLEFVDASGVAWSAAPGDFVVLIYAGDGALRAVHDLASGRHLWLTPKGSCFVATAVYGPGAPELDVLRAFRDRVLARSGAGRAFVRAYYRRSPALAEALASRPRARALVRAGLDPLVAALRRLP